MMAQHKGAPGPRSRRKQQAGYLLMVMLITVAVMVVSAAAVAPRIAQQIRREREEELIHRGTQYAMAIKRYYKRFGRYPTNLDQLENTNGIRFLRKRYRDPITGADEWRLIHLGEAKITPKTFGNAAGTGASSTAAGAAKTGTPQTSTFGTSAGSFGTSAGSLFSAGSSQIGTSSPQTGTSSPAGATTGPSSASSTSGTSKSTSDATASGSGSGLGTPASQISSRLGSGRTFGGGAIVGVASLSDKESLKEWNGADHYKDWEFVYDPRLDRGNMLQNQTRQPGTPAGGPGGFGSSSPRSPQPSGSFGTSMPSPRPLP